MGFEFEEVKNKNLISYYRKSECPQLKGKNKELVKISKDNVLQIEKILKIDSSYAYGKAINLIEKLHTENSKYENIIASICSAINNENSTRISKKEMKKITDKILKNYNNYNSLMKGLEKQENQEDEKRKYPVLMDIIYYGKKKKIRHNLSFATKFCHYMSIYKKGEKFSVRDGYPIFDNIMSKALVLYIDYFFKDENDYEELKTRYKNILTIYKKKITKVNLRKGENKSNFKLDDNYGLYVKLIDKIINKAAEIECKNTNEKSLEKCKVSRNGLDHLLWYCYKGRLTGKKEGEEND